MESKKTAQADLESQRTTRFLLGLVVALALLFVALEWTDLPDEPDVAGVDLQEIIHESEMIPMSNEEKVVELRQQSEPQPSERLRVVEDNVELAPTEEAETAADDGADELTMQQQDEEDNEALAPLGVDMEDNPLNFHVVEDLPQFPGGAVEFMKWLTKNLKYPPLAQQRKVQGRVVCQFYVEKDGSVSGVAVTQSLSAECDREALRVLRMMPKWKAGVQHDRPCRTKVCIPIVFKL